MPACALCLSDSPLRESHLVPAFVYAWLKESSPGLLRTADTPNRRVQDGFTASLLCDACEGLFATWEKAFAEQVFRPHVVAGGTPVSTEYGAWCLKFAVSVSFRVATYFLAQPRDDADPHDDALTREAVNAWRAFLTDQSPHPGPYEQHLVILDTVEAPLQRRLSPYFNRYVLRSVHLDILHSRSAQIVFSKMCQFLLFGWIRQEAPRKWRNTKLHLKRGVLGPCEYALPEAILSYLNEKADATAGALASLSDAQRTKLERHLWANVDALKGSEVMRAVSANVAHAGKEAFRITSRKPS